MKEKKEKLKDAYEHIRSLGKVHIQKEFADKIKCDERNLSSAFNGEGKYLTDNLFKRICKAFPDIFNIDYFLKNEGSMLKHNYQTVGDINNSTAVGVNVYGNDNCFQIAEQDIMRSIKFYQDLSEKQQQQIEKLLIIIENLSKK